MASARKPIISGNWKMNHNHFEAIQTVQKLGYLLRGDDYDKVEVSVHPPFTDIRSVQTTIEAEKKIEIRLGAQNCHWEEKGAFTGEVAPPMLAKLGVELVIVGHSERRELFGETDDMVNDKVKAVFKHGMIPIMCVGETILERREGSAVEKVTRQVVAGLRGLEKEQVGAMVIAYEPIWAIGTGETASSDDAQAMCAAIRQCVRDEYGAGWADEVRIQYGGSVNDANIAELMAEADIDGALVGGASLDPDRFARICQFREHDVSARPAPAAAAAPAAPPPLPPPDPAAAFPEGAPAEPADEGATVSAADQAAEWMIGAVVAQSASTPTPLTEDQVAMLRTPVGQQTEDREAQERRRDLNNQVVPLIRAAVDETRGPGIQRVELRRGLSMPMEWALNYKLVIERRQPWLISAIAQMAFTRNLLANERRDWKSK
jgi:triosephosphate isomerase